MVFILLRNIASSLKFELISCTIRLVFFFAMELDTLELFHCLDCDCNYRDEKLCDVSKADCIARDYIMPSKLLEVSEALRVYLNQNVYVRISQKAKGEISN